MNRKIEAIDHGTRTNCEYIIADDHSSEDPVRCPNAQYKRCANSADTDGKPASSRLWMQRKNLRRKASHSRGLLESIGG